MASEIDICNLGLGHIGQSRLVTSISPPDGSVEATLCSKFYPLALTATLELHDWGFATARTSLSITGTAPDGWEYQYAWPNLVVRPHDLYITDDDTPQEYTVEHDAATGLTVILTDASPATLKYTRLVTDVNRFTGLFRLTLSHMLASFLAGPIIKGKAGQTEAANQRQIALGYLGQASVSDANGQKKQTRSAPAYSANRVRPASIRSRS